jgi:hypothetical protein
MAFRERRISGLVWCVYLYHKVISVLTKVPLQFLMLLDRHEREKKTSQALKSIILYIHTRDISDDSGSSYF